MILATHRRYRSMEFKNFLSKIDKQVSNNIAICDN
jgi:hypothetical protein